MPFLLLQQLVFGLLIALVFALAVQFSVLKLALALALFRLSGSFTIFRILLDHKRICTGVQDAI